MPPACYYSSVQLEEGIAMFGFFRKKSPPPKTADTFVEATGGGWSKLPDTIPVDGGVQADFVGQILERARVHALQNNVLIGQRFELVITDIPTGILTPHEISAELMMRASDRGLSFKGNFNERASFIRLE